jgi:hypothetical protein
MSRRGDPPDSDQADEGGPVGPLALALALAVERFDETEQTATPAAILSRAVGEAGEDG